eukprot:SAG11_NODE_3956_length_2133_cov_1.666175_1_plen_148_part_00
MFASICLVSVPCQDDAVTGIAYYSPAGDCIPCLPPNVPSAGRTFCSASVCIPGTTCPLDEGQACERDDQCDQCPPGSVSLGGDCNHCADYGPGKVANEHQSACRSCPGGTEANTDRTDCTPFGANRYSMFGYEVCIAPRRCLRVLGF